MPSQNEILLEKRTRHVPQGPFNTTPAFIKEAHGAVMVDVEGRELIDFAGGIGVNNVGHCHPKVVAAIRDQAGKCIHSCFHVAMYEAYVTLAERLNGLAPGDFDKMTRSDGDYVLSNESDLGFPQIFRLRPKGY